MAHAERIGGSAMSAARPDTWMPLYIGDYLADTMHLQTAEHGAYLLLLFACWRGCGPLPDDDRKLAAIAKLTPRQWRDMRPTILAFFERTESGWVHKRVQRELLKARSFVEQRRAAGTISAAKRQRQVNEHSTPVGPPLPTDDQRTVNEDPTNAQRDGQRKAKTLPSPSQGSVSSLRSLTAADAADDDLTEIPLSLAKPIADDWGELVWKLGLPWLSRLYEKPPDRFRSQIGRWRALAEGDDRRLFALFAEAQSSGIADPLAWITARLGGKRGKQRIGGEPTGFDAAVAGARSALAGRG